MYLAYLSSFITILVMWMGHHNLFRYIVRVDYIFLILNGLFLLGVTLVPVPTAILARFVESSPAESALSAALYSGMFFYLATLFNVMWIYASSDSRLVEGYELPRAIKLRYAVGPLLYLISLGLAFVSVRLSLAIYLILIALLRLADKLHASQSHAASGRGGRRLARTKQRPSSDAEKGRLWPDKLISHGRRR